VAPWRAMGGGRRLPHERQGDAEAVADEELELGGGERGGGGNVIHREEGGGERGGGAAEASASDGGEGKLRLEGENHRTVRRFS